MSKEKQIAEICAITSNACCMGCEETPFFPESSGICDYLDCRSCKEARLLLNAGYRKQEWISVNDRMPNENGRFLTVDKLGDVMVCYWAGRFGWLASVCNKNAITHWMPLPEPPKGE